MSDFRRLEVVQAQTASKQKDENIDTTHYLGKKAQHIKEKHIGRIDQVTFCAARPHDLAVCTSARVHVYGLDTLKPKKAFTRFTTNVTCADIRDDGQMVATGCASGTIQLFDMGSRAVLRTFNDHKTAVYKTKFLSVGSKLLTCSDDHTAKIYDIPSETIIHELKCHTDSVRCAMESTLSPDIIITAGYDHKVSFTDLRLPQEHQTVLQINTGAPVTSLVMQNGSGLIGAAGDQSIKLYDMVTGGRQLSTFGNHTKAITGLTIDQPKSRLLSVALDGTLRTYNLGSLSAMGKIDYKEPLLSIDISKDGLALAVGAVGGNLYLEKPPIALTKKEEKNNNRGEFYMTARQRHFFGSDYQGNSETDILIEYERKRKLAQFDQRLKNFQHGAALDAALATASPATICALVDELELRGALVTAISNRDDAGLDPIFSFVIRYISSPQYSASVIKLGHVLLDVYTSAVGSSSLVDEWLMKLSDKLNSELESQRDCMQLIGELDLFLHNCQ